jgi:hypothetical protein
MRRKRGEGCFRFLAVDVLLVFLLLLDLGGVVADCAAATGPGQAQQTPSITMKIVRNTDRRL